MVKSKKHAKDNLESDGIWSTRNLIWGTVIIALFTGIVFLAYKTKSSQPREYEGTVIDKGARYRHSELGSRPVFHLLVETRSGQRISVTVDRELYYRVKIGTWIKKTETGVELSAKQNESAPAERDDPLMHIGFARKANEGVREAVSEPEAVATGSSLVRKTQGFYCQLSPS